MAWFGHLNFWTAMENEIEISDISEIVDTPTEQCCCHGHHHEGCTCGHCDHSEETHSPYLVEELDVDRYISNLNDWD